MISAKIRVTRLRPPSLPAGPLWPSIVFRACRLLEEVEVDRHVAAGQPNEVLAALLAVSQLKTMRRYIYTEWPIFLAMSAYIGFNR